MRKDNAANSWKNCATPEALQICIAEERICLCPWGRSENFGLGNGHCFFHCSSICVQGLFGRVVRGCQEFGQNSQKNSRCDCLIKKSKGVATSEITWHLFIILSVIILIAAVGLAIKSIVFDEYGKAPSGEVTVA